MTAWVGDQSGLGGILGATIVCPDIDAAAATYAAAFGWREVERGAIAADRARCWNAPAVTGARYVLLSPAEGGSMSFLRFVEDATASPPRPYTTAGWTAIELTVQSSVEAVKSASRNGFAVKGPAEALGFSNGALWAGQVAGPYGEVVYLTQINRQIDNFTLPQAGVPVDRLFIAITLGGAVAAQTEHFASRFATPIKDSFDAAIPFVADYQGLPPDTEFHVGCVALAPGHYLELDEMPMLVDRVIPEGTLGGGIAMITVACSSFADHAGDAIGAPCAADSGLLYADGESLVVLGPAGERLELVTRHAG